jgi:hypothetical protein
MLTLKTEYHAKNWNINYFGSMGTFEHGPQNEITQLSELSCKYSYGIQSSNVLNRQAKTVIFQTRPQAIMTTRDQRDGIKNKCVHEKNNVEVVPSVTSSRVGIH